VGNANPSYPDITLTTSKGPLKPIKGDHRYFDFSQNNTGGDFHRDENLGDHVIIAAIDHEDANKRLQRLGGYFNGCDDGSDCSCCGDRWYEKGSYDKGDEAPLICSMLIPQYMATFSWPGRRIIVYHADGYRDTYVIKDASADDDGLA
jgi:hypothetical protein